jgi:hypothetical protein
MYPWQIFHILFMFYTSIFSTTGILCAIRVRREGDAWNFSAFINDGISDDNKRKPSANGEDTSNK